MTSKSYTHERAGDNAEALEQRAEALRVERETLLERARELRSERHRRPIALTLLAEQVGVAARPLIDAARRGDLEAWRIGGAERGELVTTLAALDAYLAKRPAAKVRAPSAEMPAEEAYEDIVAQRSA